MSMKRKFKRQDERTNLSKASFNEGFNLGFREGRKDGVLHHAKIMEERLLTLSEVKGIGDKTFLKILLHLGYKDKA